MLIQHNEDSIISDDYNNWVEKVFTNEGIDDSVERMRDIFECLGCNQDLSNTISKKVTKG